MSTLVERLLTRADDNLGEIYTADDRALDREAAEALSARLTPPAEIVRYGLVPLDDASNQMQPCGNGEWLRYEDHAAALAASEAKRKDAETRVQFAKDELAAIASLIKDNIVENGRPGDGIVIKGERHTGPVVDFTFRVLRGIQQIAANSVIALDQPKTEDAASDVERALTPDAGEGK